MISTGYPFKCATRYDKEEYVCYLSEDDKIQDVFSKFMETILGKNFKPSKYYGVCIVYRGKQLRLVDEIFQIFSKKFANNIMLCFTQKKVIINSYSSQMNFLKRTPKQLQLITLKMKNRNQMNVLCQ